MLLYNDEVHSFDDVIGELRRVVECTAATARAHANTVDKDGRAHGMFAP